MALEAAIDAIAAAIEPPVDPVAAPVEPPLDAIALPVELARFQRMARRRRAVGRGVVPPFDPLASLVEAMIDPIALAIEAAIDAIAPVLRERGGGEDEPCDEGCEREGETAAHWVFLRSARGFGRTGVNPRRAQRLR